jgi:hypothetical protein
MNKDEIIDFLLEKKGFLKEGSQRLADKLGTDPETALAALREARKIVREEDNEINNLVLKSKWQTAGGEWRESYTTNKNKTSSEFKELKNELIKDIRNLSPLQVKTREKNTKDPVALEISIPDFHFGKIDGNSIQEQADIFVETVLELYDKSSGYDVERIVMPIGNDLFNSEGMRATTTKGTPQTDNSDWRVNYRIAWMSIVKSINYLAGKAPVDIIVVPGNHDFERTYYLGETLGAYYFNNNNVKVTNNGESRNYYVYGKNLIGYTHGDKEKPHELPLIMAVEQPLLFANTTTRCWHLGHIHKHMKDEYQGVEVEFLPSLCGADEWHRAMGYIGSKKRATAYIWNKETGKEGFLQVNR